jgi:hypothetical protein
VSDDEALEEDQEEEAAEEKEDSDVGTGTAKLVGCLVADEVFGRGVAAANCGRGVVAYEGGVSSAGVVVWAAWLSWAAGRVRAGRLLALDAGGRGEAWDDGGGVGF